MVVAVGLAATACGQRDASSRINYYGTDSQQALLDFTATVEIPWDGGVNPGDLDNPESDLAKKVTEGVELQWSHLFGYTDSTPGADQFCRHSRGRQKPANHQGHQG